MLPVLHRLKAAGRLFFQVVFEFLYVKGSQRAEKFNVLFLKLVRHSLEGYGLFGPDLDQGLHLTLYRDDDSGSGGVITQNRRCFLDKTLKAPKIQFQSDFSLATGGDCPVEPGNGAASTGTHVTNV